GETNAVVTFTPTATDNCSGVLAVNSTPLSGSLFPLGTTSVRSIATDAAGNTNSCSFNVTVNPASVAQADLPLVKTASLASVSVGSEITYTLSVSNAGPEVATNVVLIDTLPTLAALVSVTNELGGYSLQDNNLVCDLGAIPAGDTAEVVVVVRPTSAGSL